MFFKWIHDYAILEKPPKIANSAKNIDIGKILITVHAMDFALVHAALPSALVAAGGQSMEPSTSAYIKMPIMSPTATPMNPMI